MGAAQAPAKGAGKGRRGTSRGACLDTSVFGGDGGSPLESSPGSHSDSDESSASDPNETDKDLIQQPSALWKMPGINGLGKSLANTSPFLSEAPGRHNNGVHFVPTPIGGWSSFTARDARGRSHDALRQEVEYVLKCIAYECDHGRVSMNVLCSNQERCDLLAQELRTRMFTVTNPVRTHYTAKVKQVLEHKARLQLPQVPEGPDGDEFMLRLFYADPAGADEKYAGVVGTFKIFIDVSLDVNTEKGHSYFFGAEVPHHRKEHFRDSRLLLKVQW